MSLTEEDIKRLRGELQDEAYLYSAIKTVSVKLADAMVDTFKKTEEGENG